MKSPLLVMSGKIYKAIRSPWPPMEWVVTPAEMAAIQLECDGSVEVDHSLEVVRDADGKPKPSFGGKKITDLYGVTLIVRDEPPPETQAMALAYPGPDRTSDEIYAFYGVDPLTGFKRK